VFGLSIDLSSPFCHFYPALEPLGIGTSGTARQGVTPSA
jgi:hypothetical protein